MLCEEFPLLISHLHKKNFKPFDGGDNIQPFMPMLLQQSSSSFQKEEEKKLVKTPGDFIQQYSVNEFIHKYNQGRKANENNFSFTESANQIEQPRNEIEEAIRKGKIVIPQYNYNYY